MTHYHIIQTKRQSFYLNDKEKTKQRVRKKKEDNRSLNGEMKNEHNSSWDKNSCCFFRRNLTFRI